jgi:hypothetical protein
MTRYYDIKLLKAAQRKAHANRLHEDWITASTQSSLMKTFLLIVRDSFSSLHQKVRKVFRRDTHD